MKKLFIAVLATAALAVPVMAAISCQSGNTAFNVLMQDGSVQEACCVGVGDGSMYSCTSDNQTWFNAQ